MTVQLAIKLVGLPRRPLGPLGSGKATIPRSRSNRQMRPTGTSCRGCARAHCTSSLKARSWNTGNTWKPSPTQCLDGAARMRRTDLSAGGCAMADAARHAPNIV